MCVWCTFPCPLGQVPPLRICIKHDECSREPRHASTRNSSTLPSSKTRGHTPFFLWPARGCEGRAHCWQTPNRSNSDKPTSQPKKGHPPSNRHSLQHTHPKRLNVCTQIVSCMRKHTIWTRMIAEWWTDLRQLIVRLRNPRTTPTKSTINIASAKLGVVRILPFDHIPIICTPPPTKKPLGKEGLLWWWCVL